jgi:hypothetical protein
MYIFLNKSLNFTFKGSMPTLILIDRTRVLINEKLNVLKEDVKKCLQTKQLNERKSGRLRLD